MFHSRSRFRKITASSNNCLFRLTALEDRTVPTAIAPPPGLISWWTGDDTTADHIGPNGGTLNNGVTFAPGKVAAGFAFNGSNYLSAETSGLPTGSSDRTLEMWVKVDTFGPGESFFAGYGTFGSFNQTYHLGTVNNGELFFSQWGEAVNGPILQAGQWYHIAVTNVGSSTTLYVNGSPAGSESVLIATPATGQFYIGRIPGTYGDERQLNGMVDEVSIYNRALRSRARIT